MRVFISWSGRRSKVVADSLRDWLVRVIQRLEPWVSTGDIRAGARWQTEISGVLATAKVGILCLTPESIDSRWLNFEAGALAKTIDNATLVCPYLIGLEPSDVPLPIGQFQSQRADYEGTRVIIKTINDALGESRLSDEQLSDSFETYWPRLKECLDNLPHPDGQLPQKRDSAEVLEEILLTVRGIARDRRLDAAELGLDWQLVQRLSMASPRHLKEFIRILDEIDKIGFEVPFLEGAGNLAWGRFRPMRVSNAAEVPVDVSETRKD